MNTFKLIYKKLYEYFGPQHWWPGKSSFEVMVGAILTQNTNWANVEKAIYNLRQANLLDARKLYKLPSAKLASLIRPAGYFNVKARRLKNLVNFLIESYGADINKMRKAPLTRLRRELLGINGIGPETADSILLYALDKPSFVVDAYTRRLLLRHKLIKEGATYDQIQKLFQDNLKKDVRLFNEYHALIVRTGKVFCKTKNPSCNICPLVNPKFQAPNSK